MGNQSTRQGLMIREQLLLQAMMLWEAVRYQARLI